MRRGGDGMGQHNRSRTNLRVQLTPDETADLHRTKHLCHLDALRTARMHALSPDTYTGPSANPLAAEAGPWAVVTKR